MKKSMANASLCVLLCTATATAYKAQTKIQLKLEQLLTYQDISSVAKEITEDILHKIYTEKGTVEVRQEFSDTGFQVGTSQLMLEKEVASYIWVHSDFLIKNVTSFEDDTELRFLNFLMHSICKQSEDTFIKMTSPKFLSN